MTAVQGGLRRLAAGALVAVLGSAGLVALAVTEAPPAAAAACAADTGVTVVVDFNELGGGEQGTCVADGGGASASDLFPRANFALRYAQRQPGFVCRVSDKPASDPCVNTAPSSAFWSLWWSTGDAGARWVFASEGATSLNVPDGGLVAFAWDERSGNVPPDADPVRPSASAPPSTNPSPSQPPAGGGGSAGGGGDDGPRSDDGEGVGGTNQPPVVSPPGGPGDAPSAGPSAAPGASPSDSPPGSAGPRARPSGSPSATPSESATPTPGSESPTDSEYPELVEPSKAEPTDAAGEAGGGLPGWVPPLALAVVLGAVAGVVLLRRRSAGSAGS